MFHIRDGSDGIEDLTGNQMEESYVLNFTTTDQDTVNPVLVEIGDCTADDGTGYGVIDPVSGIYQLSANTSSIVILTNEPILANGSDVVTNANVSLVRQSDSTTVVINSLTRTSADEGLAIEDGYGLVIDPSNALLDDTTYSLSVTGLTDVAGNPLPAVNVVIC